MCEKEKITKRVKTIKILTFYFQEQPLLLEDLLEQEKREQARHSGSSQADQMIQNPNQQSILSDMVSCFEKLND